MFSCDFLLAVYKNQMNEEIIVLVGLTIIGFTIVLLLLKKWIGDIAKGSKPSDELLEWLRSTNTRLDEQNKTIVSTLQSSTRSLNERLDNAARFIASVQKNIGEMTELGRGMKDLTEFLKSPKLRGNVGEHILKELLSQMLPKQSFHLQYGFKSGSVVDAAIKTNNGIIPIDAKFPMENFRKLAACKDEKERVGVERVFVSDVKKHIDDISKKYILTEEGTIDYALMYLPSEAIYYEIVNHPTLFEYAGIKRVLPVSPMTFYAYMRTILASFEGAKIELEAKKILATIRALQKDYGKVEESLGVLSRHLTNAYHQMTQVASGFAALGHKLSSTHSLEEKENVKQLEIDR